MQRWLLLLKMRLKKTKKITASIGFYGCTQSMSGTFLGATGWSGEKIMHRVACIESCRAVDNAVYAIHNQVNIGATLYDISHFLFLGYK